MKMTPTIRLILIGLRDSNGLMPLSELIAFAAVSPVYMNALLYRLTAAGMVVKHRINRTTYYALPSVSPETVRVASSSAILAAAAISSARSSAPDTSSSS